MKLKDFKDIPFLPAIKALFKELKVPMNYVADEPTTAEEILKDTYKENETFQLVDDVYFVGMIDDAAFEGNQSLDTDQIKSDYDGILVFGVTLHQRQKNLLPTRSQLAEISRAFNREFYYTPVVLVFKYQNEEANFIAFANTERLKYKQAWREGEKAGKVSLLRDINIEKPHRGHEDIINQLRIPTSGAKAVDSFAKLYTYWQEIFSVSVLNKKFYQELSDWYFWARGEVVFPSAPLRIDYSSESEFEEALDEHNGKNLIRLLTRILFVWFVKEKGLIPPQIFDEKFISEELLDEFEPQKPHGFFAQGKHTSRYYRAVLQNLFFATLNCEKDKREFRKDDQHQNTTHLLRYRNYLKNPEFFVELMESQVPFMNGGLFDCLDKPHKEKRGRQGGDIIIYQDGFSDRDDNPLSVPDYLFFDKDEEVDLRKAYGQARYKKVKTKGLLKILESYKFTITENTPIEEDVALDPELLGRVFENLLASYNPETKTTARKQTGSFYTPREIVNYMVDESLIAYLKSSVDQRLWDRSNDDIDNQLRKLVAFDNQTKFEASSKLKTALIKSIDNCKILDPACGSGAFPMGVLQKMVHILHKVDPDNEEWKQRQLNKIDEAISRLNEIEDSEIRDKSVKELQEQKTDIEQAFEKNDLDYGRKLYLIENCIYGVDIQSIAVQISKLRFFISLIVDQHVDNEKRNFGIRPLPNLETKFVAANTLIGVNNVQGLFDNQEVKELESQIKLLNKKLFSIKTPSRKRELREEIKALRNQMATILEDEGLDNQSARQLAEWDPFDQNTSSPFFDIEWMFNNSTGFSIVIGNPPYISYYSKQSKALDPTDERHLRDYDFLNGAKKKVRINSMMFFIEKGLKISAHQGIITFIQDLNILENPYEAIRKYVYKKATLSTVLFGLNEFENVASGQVITLILNQKSQNAKVKLIEGWQASEHRLIALENKSPYLWTPSRSKHVLEIIEKASDGVLEKLLQSHTGVAVNATPEGKAHFIRHEAGEFTYPLLLGGESITHSFCIAQPKAFLRYNKIEESEWNDEFDQDYFLKKGSHQRPFNLRRIEEYNRPRIILRQSDIKLTSTYLETTMFSNYSLFNIFDDLNRKENLLFYTILLNSKLLSFYGREKDIILVKPGKTPQIRSGQRGPIGIKQLPLIEYRGQYEFLAILCKLIIDTESHSKVLLDILDSIVFNLYFPKHMEDKEIDIIEDVEKDFNKTIQGRDFDSLSDSEKEKVIEQLQAVWSHPDNEVRNRMKLFAVRSPEILKPILES